MFSLEKIKKKKKINPTQKIASKFTGQFTMWEEEL